MIAFIKTSNSKLNVIATAITSKLKATATAISGDLHATRYGDSYELRAECQLRRLLSVEI